MILNDVRVTCLNQNSYFRDSSFRNMSAETKENSRFNLTTFQTSTYFN